MYTDIICPYPGLRPFTEEESIYFKGRELHIEQIISQLEEKKFVMLTGASGDGKSSLVYAGVIPNARAGFFKAKFNNWLIADFRPERSPLKNFARAVAGQLELPADKVEKELSYGFSSLIELYKSSPFYLDYEGEEWKNADADGQKALKRKASNLFLLVDQFEEFFTNPENYSHGRTSVESQTVINLLLETARLSLELGLPIYIICTMRSDYIGQCASFRNLPEYIGFSQFFVPRLKRKEIHQVIDEPAILSGNSISQRLIEALINELNEGLDQLPVLQQTLHQIWKKANETKSQMDLIHLAMLCGLPPAHLPEEDVNAFNHYRANVPDFKKPYFDKPSLENVLDSHANELYESAYDYYYLNNDSEAYQVTPEETKQIIKTAFQSLTKIDDNRAVRSRMTLQEITDMLQMPHIDYLVVGGVLNIFREQGNTFVKPFITDHLSREADPDTVLDITHEALIRNWGLLKEWSNEEYENYQTYQDFDKQLQRWLQSGKSKDYLLPVGSLTFFEKWYSSANLSKYWLAKYDENSGSFEEKVEVAGQKMNSIILFIETSRKTISRKRNLFIVSAIAIIIILTGFTVWAMVEKNKAEIQKNIAITKTQEAIKSKEEAISSKNVALAAKAKARESETQALTAKELALKAKDEAEKANEVALVAKTLAEQEAIKAEHQSKIARDQAYKAELQKQIANAEKEKAEKAEQRARQLTLLSVAQNMALKSVIQKDDPQLQGLLALQAFQINKENKGSVQDPHIYEGLRNAFSTLDGNKHHILKGSLSEVRSLAEINNNAIVSGDKDGMIHNWDLGKNTITSSVKIKYKSPVNTLFFSPSGNNLVTGHDNFAICFWDFKSGKPTHQELASNGLLRAVAFKDDKNFATGGKDNVVSVWSLKTDKPVLNKSIKTSAPIKALAYSASGKKLVAGLEDGNVVLLNIESGDSEVLYAATGIKPLSLAVTKNSNSVVVGFADGRIRIFDLDNLKKAPIEYHTHNTGVDFIVFSKDEKLLATVGADKSIKIYNFGNLDISPIRLRNHASKVRSILFTDDGKIVAGCVDNTIRQWEISSVILAEKICPLLKRNMRNDEWEKYVGKDINYQKTCTELP